MSRANRITRWRSLGELIRHSNPSRREERPWDVFVRQLENYARPGDLVLVMSVSGNSPNVVKAVEWCKRAGVFTAALVGARRGRLAELADEPVVIADAHYGRAEDAHMAVCHMLCYAFMENPDLAR